MIQRQLILPIIAIGALFVIFVMFRTFLFVPNSTQGVTTTSIIEVNDAPIDDTSEQLTATLIDTVNTRVHTDFPIFLDWHDRLLLSLPGQGVAEWTTTIDLLEPGAELIGYGRGEYTILQSITRDARMKVESVSIVSISPSHRYVTQTTNLKNAHIHAISVTNTDITFIGDDGKIKQQDLNTHHVTDSSFSSFQPSTIGEPIRYLLKSPLGDHLIYGTDTQFCVLPQNQCIDNHGTLSSFEWHGDNVHVLISASQSVVVWNTDTNEQIILAEDGIAHWNPDGTMVAIADQRATTIKTYPSLETLVVIPTESISSFAWNPEGSQLAFAHSNGVLNLWQIGSVGESQ